MFMKFSSILLFAAAVSAQLTAPTRNFNVTSPVSNGPYVVGQILPCTYRLFSDVDSTALNLQIDLVPSGSSAPAALPANPASTVSNNATSSIVPIIANADVSKTEAFIKREGNLTYFEHSINFNIPTTIKPGQYNVVFFDRSTNTKLPVPIEVRPAAASSSISMGPKPTGNGPPGQPQSSGSIFSQGAGASTATVSKAFIGLVGVATVAFLL